VLDSIVPGESTHARVFHYSCRYPIAAYLFSLAIAPYVVWEQSYAYNEGRDTMPIIHYVYPEYYAMSLNTYGKTPLVMDVYTRAFGPYPFLAEKYGHASVGYSAGAMEHQTVSSMSGTRFGFESGVIIHELAHQWWGDMVTCATWHDIWLSEGWATYAEAVYELDRLGWVCYHQYMNNLAYYGTGSVYRYGINDLYSIFNVNLIYNKAAWVVHMLRGVLGEEKFAAGMAAYRNAFAYGSATTEDFKTAWEQGTGVELDAFIDQWIYGEQYPRYEYSYLVEPVQTGGYDLFLAVQQVQLSTPQTFVMPVDFYFERGSGLGDTLTVNVKERSQVSRLHFDEPVTAVELDPAGWILKSEQLRPWTLFLVTVDDEIPQATVGKPYFKMMEARALIGSYEMFCNNRELPSGLTLSPDGLISGTPVEAGQYAFVVQVKSPSTGCFDYRMYHLTVNPAPCCVGKVGDVNGLDGDEPTIGDIALLIDMLFVHGNQPSCMAEADINRSGGANPTADDITIGDVTMLIDYLFISGSGVISLSNCPG
jgi:hypothetical protein